MNPTNNEALHDEVINKTLPKLLAVIVNRADSERTEQLIHSMHFPFLLSCVAEGTAGKGLADLMGFGPSSKSLLMCIAPGAASVTALHDLDAALHLEKPGHGIAFTIPISGLTLPDRIPADETKKQNIQHRMEESIESMSESITHDLILAVVNQGFSEALMESAQEAGITGGTVINVRHLSCENAEKFLGCSLQTEKEIVAILVSRGIKQQAMDKIGEFYHAQPKAQGTFITLPVDNVVGLRK